MVEVDKQPVVIGTVVAIAIDRPCDKGSTERRFDCIARDPANIHFVQAGKHHSVGETEILAPRTPSFQQLPGNEQIVMYYRGLQVWTNPVYDVARTPGNG